MTDWQCVKEDLESAGYSGFELDSGETAVPGLSGRWISGHIPREGGLKKENQPLLVRILDTLPGGGTVSTDPKNLPEDVLEISSEHSLRPVIVSVSADEVRVALCEPDEPSPSW